MNWTFPLDTYVTGLDPQIPVVVKKAVQHSSHWFEAVLRVDKCLSETFEHIIGSINQRAVVFYRGLSLLTMSFWPFLGLTILYRFFMSGQSYDALVNVKDKNDGDMEVEG